eukprot:663716-Pleurochrysis_carterae.AAC.1
MEVDGHVQERTCPWKFMDTMVVHGSSWKFMDVYGCLWMFMEVARLHAHARCARALCARVRARRACAACAACVKLFLTRSHARAMRVFAGATRV